MIYTVTNSGLEGINGRPTSIGENTITINWGEEYVHNVANFTTETTPVYSDPENDPLSYIKVLSRPDQGKLYLNGVEVQTGDTITSGDLSTGNLKYVPLSSLPEDGYLTAWRFDAADTGSNSLTGTLDGVIIMEVLSGVNLPPDVVGDKSISLAYGVTKVFSTADFTSGTIPAYNDPEGDAPYQLKILDLPSAGFLLFNNIVVVANQVIDFTEVDAGYLRYMPDNAIVTSQSLNFNFSVSDTGSNQFAQ